jgi:hypothetical protein
MLGIRILGAIVNGIRDHSSPSYGYSYESRRATEGPSVN